VPRGPRATKKPGGWSDPGRRVSKIRFLFVERQNTPSTMAPTRAKARYAVTTLNLVTKGRTTIFMPPKVMSLPTRNAQGSNAFHAKKVSFAVCPRHLGSAQRLVTWLKRREIKALMSP
jgi:hypothetical protein